MKVSGCLRSATKQEHSVVTELPLRVPSSRSAGILEAEPAGPGKTLELHRTSFCATSLIVVEFPHPPPPLASQYRGPVRSSRLLVELRRHRARCQLQSIDRF